jgi:hypothetical protein
MVKMIGFDAKSIARARKLGAEEMARSPVSAVYSAREDSVLIKMPSGTSVKIPRPWIEELRDLAKSDLKHLRLDFVREAIEVPPHDIHTSAMGLLRDAIFGEDPYARAGRATSPAKARAARRNGAKGGRPKKKAARR